MSEHEWLSSLIGRYAYSQQMIVLELSHDVFGTAVLGLMGQRVRYARSGALEGAAAFHYLWRWGSGSLEGAYHMSVEPNIDRPLAMLMLEARRRARDLGRLEALDVHDTLESWPPEPCGCDDLRRWNALAEWSYRHLACPELQGIELFEASGTCVRRYDGARLERMPQAPGDLGSMIAELEALGESWELMFSHGDTHHVVVPLENAPGASVHVALDARRLNLVTARAFVERTLRSPASRNALRRAGRRRACLCYSAAGAYGRIS